MINKIKCVIEFIALIIGAIKDYQLECDYEEHGERYE